MKIALVILHSDPTRGGAERYTVDLANALNTRGHEVTFITTSAATPSPCNQGEGSGFSNNQNPLPDYREREHCATVILAATGFTRTARYHNFLNSLDAHFDRHKYNIIHAMLPIHHCDVYHPHAGMAVESRMSIFTPRRKAMAQVEQQLLYAPKPPRVLCLSEYVKQSVRKHYPLGASHLPVLFNAVDLERFALGEPKPHDDLIALMIAQDFERKGLRQTLEALAKIDDKRLKLRVIGKDDPGTYRKLAERLGIADRVQFAGPTTDPAGEYRNADFFILPTRHDPCSLVVLESLAMGLPVISTRFNGACEIMTDGKHGFVLSDPNNIDALSAAMKKMLDEPTRLSMRAACLELRSSLSYERHLDRLIQIYEQIAVQSK